MVSTAAAACCAVFSWYYYDTTVAIVVIVRVIVVIVVILARHGYGVQNTINTDQVVDADGACSDTVPRHSAICTIIMHIVRWQME